jgi:hypothetical protein
MKIQWKFQDEPDDGTSDLTGTFNDKYVDVVHRPSRNTWSVYYDNKSIMEGITTRERAKQYITHHLENPLAPQKSFTISLFEDEQRKCWAYSVDCPLGACAIGFGVDPVDAAKVAVRQLNKSIKYMAKEAKKKLASGQQS